MPELTPNKLACLGEVLVVLQIEDAILGPGRLPRRVSWGLAGLIWLLTQGLTRYFTPFTLPALLFSTVRYSGFTLLFGGSMRRKLLAILVFGGFLMLYGDFTGLLLAALYGKDFGEVWYSDLTGLVYGVLSNLLVFFEIRVLRRQIREMDTTQKMMSGSYLAVILLSSIVLAELSQSSRQYGFLVFICFGFLLSAGIYLALSVLLGRASTQARRAQKKMLLEQARADALMSSYQTQRKLTHEFTNHLDAMNCYLEQQDLQGARNYLSGLSQNITSATAVVNTHNPLLDALLSTEYRDAAKHKVQLSFDLCDLEHFPLRDTELVTVMCNLLDNAIRAAEGADPPYVALRIRHAEQEFVVSVRNRVAQPLDWNGKGQPPSTKQEPGHGIGLGNVCSVLERSGGYHTISCKDGWFCFTFAVPDSNL